MLLRQDGCGHENRHLSAALHDFERCPDSYLRLAVADVPAHQAVHRFGQLKVGLDSVQRRYLVRCLFVREAGFEGVLPRCVRGRRKPVHRRPCRVQGNEFSGQLLGSAFRPGPRPGPLLRTQPREARGRLAGAVIQLDAVKVLRGNVELVVLRVFQHQVLADVLSLQRGCADETRDAVLHVHHVNARMQLGELRPAPRRPSAHAPAFLGDAEHLAVGQHHQPVRPFPRKGEPLAQVALYESDTPRRRRGGQGMALEYLDASVLGHLAQPVGVMRHYDGPALVATRLPGNGPQPLQLPASHRRWLERHPQRISG